MWVHGDLKERLGIKHRRELQASAQSDMEQAPMFHRPHFRSESEISSFHPDSFPGVDGLASPPGLRSRSISGTNSGTNSEPRSPSRSLLSSPPPPAMYKDQPDAATSTGRAQMSPSPYRGSYYSASNIPAPSPLPGQSEPPMSSVSSQPVAAFSPPSPNTLHVPGFRGHPPNPTPEMYEMHVRSTTEESQTATAYTGHPVEATDATYATAYDDTAFAPGAAMPASATVPATGNLIPGHPPDEAWRSSSYSTYSNSSGPTVL